MREEDGSCAFAERRMSLERGWYLIWNRQEEKEVVLRWSVLEFVLKSDGNQEGTRSVVERR